MILACVSIVTSCHTLSGWSQWSWQLDLAHLLVRDSRTPAHTPLHTHTHTRTHTHTHCTCKTLSLNRLCLIKSVCMDAKLRIWGQAAKSIKLVSGSSYFRNPFKATTPYSTTSVPLSCKVPFIGIINWIKRLYWWFINLSVFHYGVNGNLGLALSVVFWG